MNAETVFYFGQPIGIDGFKPAIPQIGECVQTLSDPPRRS